ncbi:hypothetical protein HanRHA438_Chr02g0054361 [Helianthus annuus]|nr:hypothetical protein HanRHA438_Chr02g0054361 [Helianthus annuus]
MGVVERFLIWPMQVSLGEEGSEGEGWVSLGGLTVSFKEKRHSIGMKKDLCDDLLDIGDRECWRWWRERESVCILGMRKGWLVFVE